MTVARLGHLENVELAHDDRRAFPGLLIQGDSVFILLEDLRERRLMR